MCGGVLHQALNCTELAGAQRDNDGVYRFEGTLKFPANPANGLTDKERCWWCGESELGRKSQGGGGGLHHVTL